MRLETAVALVLPTQEPGPLSNVESLVASRFGAFLGEDPLGVTTVTLTVPEPWGATAVKELSFVTVKEGAIEEPNLTDFALRNPPPVMVTTVPPSRLPRSGPTEATLRSERL